MIQTPRPIITLTTDFGSSSAYVAQMKGVILSRNVEVQLVDITHDVPPQDVRSAAILLDDVCRRFPPRTIHVVVVDPGVGTQRKLIFAESGGQFYLAPDNGVLTLVARRNPPPAIIAITNAQYFLSEVSATFHGRDILAPVAAYLSLGLDPEQLGDRLRRLEQLSLPQPFVESRRIAGSVVQIDAFGNVITNITATEFGSPPPLETVRVRCGNHEIAGVFRTYGDQAAGTLIALFGSNGRLELAKVNGNAAATLGAHLGDPVVVEW